MSVVVRELIALFVARVEQGSFNALENRIGRLRQAAIGVAAVMGGQKLFAWAEEASRFEDARRIFVEAGGDLKKLRVETKGMLGDFELVKGFNLAEQFGLSQYFSKFVQISDVAAKKFGITQAEAFQRIIRGTARGSAPILDNLGIQLVGRREAIKEAFVKAHKLNKSASELSGTELSQAYAEAAIEQSKSMLDQMNRAGATLSDTFDRLKASAQNFAIGIGEVGLAFGPLIDKFSSFANHLVDVMRRLKDDQDFKDRLQSISTAIEYTARSSLAVWRVASAAYDILPVKSALAFAAVWRLRGAFMALSAVLTTSLTAGALQWAFIAAASVAAPLAGAVALTAAFAGLAGVIVLAGEEIVAAFDQDVDGFFETWVDRWDELDERLQRDFDAEKTGLGRFFIWVERKLVYFSSQVGELIHLITGADAQGDAFDPFADGEDKVVGGYTPGQLAPVMAGLWDSEKKELLARVKYGQNLYDARRDTDGAASEDDAALHFQQWLDSHPAVKREMGSANDNNAYARHVYSPVVNVNVTGVGADAQQMSMMIREQVEGVVEEHVLEMSTMLRPGAPE